MNKKNNYKSPKIEIINFGSDVIVTSCPAVSCPENCIAICKGDCPTYHCPEYGTSSFLWS